jgi:hypothetical protein
MPPNFNPVRTSFEGDACIVEEAIDSSKLLFDLGHELVDTFLISHIQLHHLNPVFILRSQYFLTSLFRQFHIPTRHYYFKRFRAQILQDPKTDPFVATSQDY